MTDTIGIIVNGASGRMGYRQHLVRSLIPIRDAGGVLLPDGTRVPIKLKLVGRNPAKLEELATLHGIDDYTTSVDEALADDSYQVYFDALVTKLRAPNLRKAMAYIFAIHVPIAGLSLLPVMFEWPLVLLPVHIAFLELIIDPACSVVFEMEAEEEDVMNRPPRDPSSPLFSARLMRVGITQGLSVLAFVMAVYVISLLVLGRGELEARSLTFTTLVLANIGLIMANRSWSSSLLAQLQRPNPAVRWVVGGSLAFLAAVLSIKALRGLFHLTVLHPVDIAICLIAGWGLWFGSGRIAGPSNPSWQRCTKSCTAGEDPIVSRSTARSGMANGSRRTSHSPRKRKRSRLVASTQSPSHCPSMMESTGAASTTCSQLSITRSVGSWPIACAMA